MSNGYLRILASDLGVDLGEAKHDLDVAMKILNSIPGSKNVTHRTGGGTDSLTMVWHKPKKFGGRDYEVTSSTFVGCTIKLGNHYKGLLLERNKSETEDEV
jgi:hypothetical protein